jgi:hypothetical protein
MQDQVIMESNDPEIAKWRGAQKRAGEPMTWKYLPELYQRELEEGNPELVELRQEMEELDLHSGSQLDKDFVDFKRTIKSNKASYNSELVNIAKSFDDGRLNSSQMRDRLKIAKANFAARQGDVFERTPRFHKVVARLRDPRSREKKLSTAFVGDIMYDLYVSEVLRNPNNEDEEGNYRFSVFEQANEEFRSFLADEELWRYIQARRKQGIYMPGVIQEYEDAKVALEPYWTIHEERWGEGSVQAEIIETYQSLGSAQKSIYTQSSSLVTNIVAQWRKLREKMRTRNPEIDRLIVKFYGGAPRTRLALIEFNERQVALGLGTRAAIAK